MHGTSRSRLSLLELRADTLRARLAWLQRSGPLPPDAADALTPAWTARHREDTIDRLVASGVLTDDARGRLRVTPLEEVA